MLTFTTGNIFHSHTDGLVNPVNCVGVMGAGLAREFKHRFPDNYRAYHTACANGSVRLGHMFTTYDECSAVWIVNFPTKGHFREASRLADLVQGLRALRLTVEALSLGSIALPALGCGLGGLAWRDVRFAIEEEFSLDDSTTPQIIVYEPAKL